MPKKNWHTTLLFWRGSFTKTEERRERRWEKKEKNNGSSESYQSMEVITCHLIRKPPIKTISTPLRKVIIESWKKPYAPPQYDGFFNMLKARMPWGRVML